MVPEQSGQADRQLCIARVRRSFTGLASWIQARIIADDTAGLHMIYVSVQGCFIQIAVEDYQK